MKYKLIALEGATLDTFVYINEAKIFTDSRSKIKYLGLRYGDKIPVSSTEVEIGGNAANVAVGIANHKFKVAVLGTIGNDEHGNNIKTILNKRGVDTVHLKQIPNTRSNASIVITHKKERTILTYRYPRPAVAIEVPLSEWIYLSHTSNRGLFYSMIKRVKTGSRLAYNPNSSQLRQGLASMKPILKLADVVFINKEEAEMMTSLPKRSGIKHLKQMLTAISSYGPKVVVVTDGLKGAYAYDGADYYHARPFPSKRLEPTGAGDSFASGFLAALIYKQNVSKALCWGSVNASSVVTKIGAQVGLLNKREILDRIRHRPSYSSKVI